MQKHTAGSFICGYENKCAFISAKVQRMSSCNTFFVKSLNAL